MLKPRLHGIVCQACTDECNLGLCIQTTVHLDTCHYYYQLYQLGTGGRTQKAKSV